MAEKKSAHEQYERFTVSQRVEHIVLVLSFSLLGLTGLIQKFAMNAIAAWLIGALGGIESVRIIHRVAAIAFALQSVYHILVLAYKVFVVRTELTMLPSLKDAIDAVDVIRYNLGLTKEHPKMPRYNFAEKVEYWAMIWGGVVMGITGFMLWNPIATSRFLPGQIIPTAKAAHGGEAVLAVLAILIWHFYSVHIKMFNKSMFTGKLTRQQMEEEHGEELQRIMAGNAKRPVDPEGVRRRQRIFVPIAAGLGLVMSLGVIWFATFEQTAIATVPPQAAQVVAFAPLTPTPVPISTVDNRALGSAIPHPVEGQENCDTCHATGAMLPYPADHEGRPVESCLICHQPGPASAGGIAQAGDGAAGAIPHPIEGEAFQECTACHGTGQMKPFPANHAGFTNDGCTICHQPAGADNIAAAIPHTIEKDMYRDCTICHGVDKIKPFPASHVSFAVDGCTLCHQPPAPGSEAGLIRLPGPIPHPIEGDAYKDCTLCHGEGQMKPFPANHTSFAVDGCTMCHQPAAGGEAPAEPGAAEQPAAGPQGVPHSVELEAFADCTKCHGGADTPHPYPENHASFTVESCTGCHPAPADETAITVNAPNPVPHSVTKPIYVNCATCHAPGVELGVRAPVSHTDYEFTAESCAACHAVTAEE